MDSCGPVSRAAHGMRIVGGEEACYLVEFVSKLFSMSSEPFIGSAYESCGEKGTFFYLAEDPAGV